MGATDLKTIKALIAAEVTPAPGTAGARCEKALSNGTYRPARGEKTCAEGLCCGAARVWMESGVTGDAVAYHRDLSAPRRQELQLPASQSTNGHQDARPSP